MTHVLTIFAHPDDAECVAGGTLLKWAAEGARITLCIITDGDKGTNDPADTREAVIARRRAEQTRAAARLGAEVIYLGREDGTLQPTLDLRRELVRVMRQVRPDRVVANDPTVWFRHALYINHPDHRAAGQAALEALYPAVKKPGIFPELLAAGLLPEAFHQRPHGLALQGFTLFHVPEIQDEQQGHHPAEYPRYQGRPEGYFYFDFTVHICFQLCFLSTVQ